MASTLTPKEARIMGMWDEGASIEAIACSVGIRKERISSIISQFDGSADERHAKADMRRGSAFLLKAIQLTGKRHRSLTTVTGLAL